MRIHGVFRIIAGHPSVVGANSGRIVVPLQEGDLVTVERSHNLQEASPAPAPTEAEAARNHRKKG